MSKKPLPRTARVIHEMSRRKDYNAHLAAKISDPGYDAFAEVLGLVAIAPEEIVPAVISLVGSSSVNWRLNNAFRQASDQSAETSSRFAAVLGALDYFSGQKPSEDGFGILTEDLKRFSPGRKLFQSEQLNEWLCKLIVYGRQTYSLLELREKAKPLGPNARKYKRLVEEQFDKTQETLGNLKLKDLPLYLHFLEHFYLLDEQIGKKEGYFTRREREALLEVNTQIPRTNEHLEDLNSGTLSTWDRLRRNWRGNDISQALSLLPGLKETVSNHVLAALEENLADLSQKGQGINLEKMPQPESVADLLNNSWKRTQDAEFLDYYSELFGEMQNRVELEGFSVPRRYLAYSAILILEEVAGRTSPEETSNLLNQVNSLISAEPATENAWLTTLLALKAKRPELSGFVEKAVSDLKTLSEPVREALLDKKPGKVLLTAEGKLKVRSKDQELTSAFPIYTSKAQETEVAQTSTQTQETEVYPGKSEENQRPTIETNGRISIPLFSDLPLIHPESVPSVVETMFSGNGSLDEDALIASFLELTDRQEWTEIAKNKVAAPNFLFHTRHNAENPLAQEMKALGIEAMYLNGMDIVFAVKTEGKLIGLTGQISQNGELSIHGLPQEFKDSSQGLKLATLALGAAIYPRESDTKFAELQIKRAIKFSDDELCINGKGCIAIDLSYTKEIKGKEKHLRAFFFVGEAGSH